VITSHAVTEPLTEASLIQALGRHRDQSGGAKGHTVHLCQRAYDELVRDVPKDALLEASRYVGAPRVVVDEDVAYGCVRIESVGP
jgi:hypothetical protein